MTDAAAPDNSIARTIIDSIADLHLAERVDETVTRARHALGELGRVFLPQDSFEEEDNDTPVPNRHVEIAPYVLSAIASVNRLLAHIAVSYAPPARAASTDDFDRAFDLMDGKGGGGETLAHPTSSASALTDEEHVAETAHTFGGMIRAHVLSFADRVENALRHDDPWPLLAELDDYKRKLTKGLQGLLFGVLGVFAKDARRDEILPEYRSSVAEAVALRSVMADLSLAVTRFNNAIARASVEQVVPLVVAVCDRLQRFAARPEYRTLRADDKKAVIDFRAALGRMRRSTGGVPMLQLKQAIEGFSTFLEAMGAINHREVLVIHDRQRLNAAAAHLNAACSLVDTDPTEARARLDQAVDTVAAVHGRNHELDDQGRLHRIDPPEPSDLRERLDEWVALVEATLQRVG